MRPSPKRQADQCNRYHMYRYTNKCIATVTIGILVGLQTMYLIGIHDEMLSYDESPSFLYDSLSTQEYQYKNYSFGRKDDTVPRMIIEMRPSDSQPGNLPSSIALHAIKQLYSGDHVPLEFVEEILLNMKKTLSSLPSVVKVDIPMKKAESLRDIFNAIFMNLKHHIILPVLSIGTPETKIKKLTAIAKEHYASSYVTIVGDTHGQFYGVMHIFATHGFPTPQNPYVFSGDMIDRGDYSVRLMLTLYLIKLSCPSCVHFIRGNHEVTYMYGTRVMKEFIKMYGSENIENVYQLFVDTIGQLPISILLHGKRSCNALVLHGGLPQENLKLEHIQKITRGYDPEDGSFFEHLLWTDVHDDQHKHNIGENIRGRTFGPNVTADFFIRNNLCLMIRGHSYKSQGYDIQHDGKVITLYSSPLHDSHKGGILEVTPDMETTIYNYQRPYIEIGEEHWSSFEGFDI